jgi:hypothetical protein
MKVILWEYKIIDVPNDSSCKAVQELLNKQGELAWELVCCKEKKIVRMGDTIERTFFVLKRPIGQKNMV